MSRLAAMGSWSQISLLVAFVALALAGCGGGDDGTIPQENGDALLTSLDALQSDFESGDCETIDLRAAEVQDQIEALPAAVDPEVRSGLEDAAAQLATLSADPPECTESGATGESEAEPTSENEVSTSTTTTEPEPEPEETTTEEEPAPAEETEPAPEQPAEEDDSGDGGGGGSSESGGVSGEFDD